MCWEKWVFIWSIKWGRIWRLSEKSMYEKGLWYSVNLLDGSFLDINLFPGCCISVSSTFSLRRHFRKIIVLIYGISAEHSLLSSSCGAALQLAGYCPLIFPSPFFSFTLPVPAVLIFPMWSQFLQTSTSHTPLYLIKPSDNEAFLQNLGPSYLNPKAVLQSVFEVESDTASKLVGIALLRGEA